MLIDLNTAREKTLIYDYTISSGDREVLSIETRFIIILDGYALTIQGEFIDDRIKVIIPPLNDIVKDVPKNKSKVQYRFEMIINNHEITIPDTGMILIESKPAIKTSKPKTFEEKNIIPIKIKEKIEFKPKSKFIKSFECYVKQGENKE